MSNDPACVCVPLARRGRGQFTSGTDAVAAKGIWEIGDMKFKLLSPGKGRWCKAIWRKRRGQIF